DPGHEPVEARVGAPGEEPQRIGDQPVDGYVRRRPPIERVVRRRERALIRSVPRRQFRRNAVLCVERRGQCRTSVVNGQTYACAMISIPISAASARLWKNT